VAAFHRPATVSAPRGRCPVCRFRFRLRADGTMQRHRLYSGGGVRVCEGGGRPAVPYDPDTCGECLEYRFMTPGLGEACASVGIEHGRDGAAMLFDVLAAYHGNGHEEPW
jgi:hypothetical protein